MTLICCYLISLLFLAGVDKEGLPDRVPLVRGAGKPGQEEPEEKRGCLKSFTGCRFRGNPGRVFQYPTRRMARFPNRQIVQELKDGHRLGCVHLVDVYYDRLVGEAVRVFMVPQLDAEELINDVLLAVVGKIGSFEFKYSDGDFHYWVMTIFRNKVKDFLRRQSLTEGVMERFHEPALEDENEYSSTEREVIFTLLRDYEESLKKPESWEGNGGGNKRGRLDLVVDALDRLETWERVLLRCRALDVPYEDIARYTGKPASQLKVYHARVKKKFIKLLTDYQGDSLVYET